MATSKHFNLCDSGWRAALRILPSLAGRREYRGRHPSKALGNPRSPFACCKYWPMDDKCIRAIGMDRMTAPYPGPKLDSFQSGRRISPHKQASIH